MKFEKGPLKLIFLKKKLQFYWTYENCMRLILILFILLPMITSCFIHTELCCHFTFENSISPIWVFWVFFGGGSIFAWCFFMCTWKCATTWASVTYKRLHLYRKLFVCLLKMVNSQQLLNYNGILCLYAIVVSVLSFFYYYK